MRKIIKCSLILGSLSMALSSSATPDAFFKILPIGGKCHGLSANGQWVVSTESRETAFLYNHATGEGIELKTNDTPFCEANSVSNDGTVVGHVADKPAYYKDGKWSFLDMPADFENGFCNHISDDGTVIYGEVFSGMYYLPVIWRNGIPELMEVPQRDLFNKIPAGGFTLDAVAWNSDRIAGRVIDSEYRWYTVLWDKGTPSYIHPELFKDSKGRPNSFEMNPGKFSPSGKYLALDLIDFELAGGERHPTLYDIENNILKSLDADLICLSDDEGRGFSCSPAGILIRTCYVHEGDVTYTLEDWMMQNYGLDIMTEGNIDASGTPMGISADNKYISGFCTNGYEIKNYLMYLGEKSGNNIDENFKLKPTVISRKNEIMISAQTGARISVYDISGRIVAEQEMNDKNASIRMNAGSYIIRILQEGEMHTYKTLVNE